MKKHEGKDKGGRDARPSRRRPTSPSKVKVPLQTLYLVLYAAGLNNDFAQAATMDSQWRVKPKGCCGGADKEHEELVRAGVGRPCAPPAFQRDGFTQVFS